MKKKKYLEPNVEITNVWFETVLTASNGNGMYYETAEDGQYFADFFKQ